MRAPFSATKTFTLYATLRVLRNSNAVSGINHTRPARNEAQVTPVPAFTNEKAQAIESTMSEPDASRRSSPPYPQIRHPKTAGIANIRIDILPDLHSIMRIVGPLTFGIKAPEDSRASAKSLLQT